MFGYDEELKRIPPVAPRCDTHDGDDYDDYDYDYDDDHDMTEDEYRVYKDQVLKSDVSKNLHLHPYPYPYGLCITSPFAYVLFNFLLVLS